MRRQLAALGLAGILLAAGCAKPAADQPAATGPVTVRFTEVIHSVFYAPQYVAEAKGFFKQEGINLDTSTAQGSDKGAAALLAGTADVALVGPETTVFVYNQDTPNKVKIFAQMTTRDGSFLMARKPDPTFDWKSLKGKSIIGWRQGSMPQMIAASVIRQHGLDPAKDVNYISNLAAPAMAGAFQSGQGDYIQVFEPIASQLEKAGAGYVVASIGSAYGSLPYTGYVATDEYLAKHPDVIVRFTRAVYRAQRYLLETDPAVVAKEIAPYFDGTDVSLIESSLRRYLAQDSWTKSPVMNPADFEKLQAVMVEGGVLDAAKKAPFDKLGTNTAAEQAVRDVK